MALGSRDTSPSDACIHADPPVSFTALFICSSYVPIKKRVTLILGTGDALCSDTYPLGPLSTESWLLGRSYWLMGGREEGRGAEDVPELTLRVILTDCP